MYIQVGKRVAKKRNLEAFTPIQAWLPKRPPMVDRGEIKCKNANGSEVLLRRGEYVVSSSPETLANDKEKSNG